MTTTVTRTEEVQAREQRHVLQTYRRQPVVFVRGEGVRLYDVDRPPEQVDPIPRQRGQLART